ncbi:MAG: GNAT family N-acetyltransferase [Coprococcus sp.]
MISVVRAVTDDAQEITNIKTRAFNKEINMYLGRNGGPPGYDKVESEIEIIKKFTAYKILLEDKIIGAFFIILLENNKVRFEDFVIEPEYQGKGYGFKTLQILEKMYPQITEWYLSTPIFSVGNQNLYEKFGYQEIGRDADEIEYCKKRYERK